MHPPYFAKRNPGWINLEEAKIFAYRDQWKLYGKHKNESETEYLCVYIYIL